jgi:hypothetical protein
MVVEALRPTTLLCASYLLCSVLSCGPSRLLLTPTPLCVSVRRANAAVRVRALRVRAPPTPLCVSVRHRVPHTEAFAGFAQLRAAGWKESAQRKCSADLVLGVPGLHKRPFTQPSDSMGILP